MSRPIAVGCAVLVLFLILLTKQTKGETWYVRPDGGTRYSVSVKGQCDGKSDAAYSGKGINQHCAFKDVRSLWTDGTYCTDNSSKSVCWRWVGAGGDTYLIRGSIATGVSYRIGQDGPNPHDYLGLAGNPYGAGIPPPPSGTATAHTRLLGENHASCSDLTARTQLHGGYGVSSVLNMAGTSYVDVACLDITDFSSCGRSGQAKGCNTNFPIDDYATNGIYWDNTSTHDTITNVRVHGMASTGMMGPTGDAVTMSGIDIIGNAGAGWNADDGSGKTGTGHLLVERFNISWNGCAEEYPLKDNLPYNDCADDNGGGYGDGFGTATVASNPGWQVHFDQGVVSYNTQDGLDALHLVGKGSSMTVTRTLAYGNMGQQIKVGGTSGTIQGNSIFTNCNAMREKIPGTPEGFNSRLSDFCRAADSGVVFTVNDEATAIFSDNIVYSASSTGVEVVVNESCKTETCIVRQQRNIFLGFRNDSNNGYKLGGTGEYSNPLYVDSPAVKAYQNPGSTFDHNTTFHAKTGWRCPASWLHETAAICGDPHLADETWHRFGHADLKQVGATAVSGAPAAEVKKTSSSEKIWASMCVAALTTGGWASLRRKNRS